MAFLSSCDKKFTMILKMSSLLLMFSCPVTDSAWQSSDVQAIAHSSCFGYILTTLGIDSVVMTWGLLWDKRGDFVPKMQTNLSAPATASECRANRKIIRTHCLDSETLNNWCPLIKKYFQLIFHGDIFHSFWFQIICNCIHEISRVSNKSNKIPTLHSYQQAGPVFNQF